MPHAVLDAMPLTLTRGDALAVRFAAQGSIAPPGYLLTLALGGPLGVIAAADPDGTASWVVTLSSAQMTVTPPGVYTWAAQATDGTDRHTLARGKLELLVDPAAIAPGTEQRSVARQILEAIEAELLAKGQITSFSVFGRSYQFGSHAELLDYRARLRAEVRDEIESERQKRGLPSRRVAWVRF